MGRVVGSDGWWRHHNTNSHLRSTASQDQQNRTNYYIDALGERFWTSHHDTLSGPQVSFYSHSDGLRPEVVSEPTYSRPSTSTPTWTATGTRSDWRTAVPALRRAIILR